MAKCRAHAKASFAEGEANLQTLSVADRTYAQDLAKVLVLEVVEGDEEVMEEAIKGGQRHGAHQVNYLAKRRRVAEKCIAAVHVLERKDALHERLNLSKLGAEEGLDCLLSTHDGHAHDLVDLVLP